MNLPGQQGAQDEGAPSPPRRKALAALTAGLGALIGAFLTVPFVAFLVSPIRRSPEPRWRPVGRLDAFPLEQTLKARITDPDPLPWAGYSSETAVWVRRVGPEELIAFSGYCTHVGCPVRWEAGAQLFICPCHGGAFYPDGSVAAGPPPVPLRRHAVRVHDGQVEVQTRPVALGA